jgi:hypothetical protein
MTRQPMTGSPQDQPNESRSLKTFEEQHFSIQYWAQRWGFSEKTVREWFRDEFGSGILRQPNVGRRKKRDYTTITVSPSAAARIYAKRTTPNGILRRTAEVT